MGFYSYLYSNFIKNTFNFIGKFLIIPFKKFWDINAGANNLPVCSHNVGHFGLRNVSLNKGTTKEICTVTITHR